MTTRATQLAFVFPGQGSQSLGMLSELASAYPVVTQTFAEASGVLDYDLWQLVQQGPESQLNQTQYTQPAMLAAGVAVWRVWQQKHGGQPAILAGHSLGEYSALVCGGAVEFATAITLVAQRGLLMQQAVPEGSGAMAALLGLDDAVVIEVCSAAEQGQVVAAVNFNSPGQVVIAGHKPAVERAIELAKGRGAKRAVMLPVSVPSHCALMKPAAEKMLNLLQHSAFSTPHIPVINNVDVHAEVVPDNIRHALSRQLYSPVRWVETVQMLAAQGVTIIIECGPGKVLAGLNKRIVREVETLPVYDTQTLELALTSTGA